MTVSQFTVKMWELNMICFIDITLKMGYNYGNLSPFL